MYIHKPPYTHILLLLSYIIAVSRISEVVHIIFTFLKKVVVIQKLDKGASLKKVYADYGVDTSTICDLKKNLENI